MTTETSAASGGPAPEQPGEHELHLARQPIFDADGNRVAYELLYRSGPELDGADGEEDAVRMTSDVLVNALLTLGLEQVTGDLPAFVNVDEDLLTAEALQILDEERATLEVLESVSVDDEVEDACRALREAGYRIALDDFEPNRSSDRLVSQADIVKIDVLDRSGEELDDVLEELAGQDVEILAERVETREMHDACCEMGFTLFQGFFYREPETLHARELGVTSTTVVRLMNLLRDPDVPNAEVADQFKSDPGLSYKLLRIVKSAAVGGRNVSSIQHAIRMLGRRRLYRWLSLLFLSSLSDDGGVNRELSESAIVRGRIMERLAEESGRDREADAYFLVGLFSLIHVLLDAPLEDVLERVSLKEDLRRSLLDGEGPAATALEAASAYEDGHWSEAEERAREFGADAKLSELYLEAVGWARSRLEEADAPPGGDAD